MKRLPDWLRRELPYLYSCIGLLTIVMVRDGVAVLSGLTLLSAAGIEWLFHRRFRRESKPVQESEFMQISWNKSFECGHPAIDAQHRRLFGIGNELINAALTWKPKFDVELLLDRLIDEIAAHFRTEEAILARNGHPITDAHHELHRALLIKATDLRNRHDSDQLMTSDLVGFIVYDIVAKHFAEDDLKYATKIGCSK